MVIILFTILLISCTSDNQAKIIANIDKIYNESLGYESGLEMKIIKDKKETTYIMKEKYIADDSISLEILEPDESRGITIEYKDDKIFLNHASIKQSISLKAVKNFDKGILLANFFENLDSVESIEREEIDGEDYYVLEYTLGDANKYNYQRFIYLSRKKLEPTMVKIFDKTGNERIVIKYVDFKYTKDI